MRDIDAKEMNGHSILALERFQPEYKWMIEFTIRSSGEEMRLFLNDSDYQNALASQKNHIIEIFRYAHVIEGHVIDFTPKKRKHKNFSQS